MSPKSLCVTPDGVHSRTPRSGNHTPQHGQFCIWLGPFCPATAEKCAFVLFRFEPRACLFRLAVTDLQAHPHPLRVRGKGAGPIAGALIMQIQWFLLAKWNNIWNMSMVSLDGPTYQNNHLRMHRKLLCFSGGALFTGNLHRVVLVSPSFRMSLIPCLYPGCLWNSIVALSVILIYWLNSR